MKYGKLMDGMICVLTAWYMVNAFQTYGWKAIPVILLAAIAIYLLAAVVIGLTSGTFHGLRGVAKYRAEQVGQHPQPFDIRVIPCRVEDLQPHDFIIRWRQVVRCIEDNEETVYVYCDGEEENWATACLDRGDVLSVVRVNEQT